VANPTDSVRLYFRLVSISIRGQMQYRASFLLYSIGTLLFGFFEFATILVLFGRFGSLRGWQLGEVGLFYGVVNTSYAIADSIGRGFDTFSLQVVSGEFDRTLLRPRSTELQVLAHDLPLYRVGRLLQALAIMVWAALNAGIVWNPAKGALVALAVAGGVAIFNGLVVLQATMCFWSTQSLEVMNSFTSGGVETLQWPLPIFNRWFARLFIFVIPLACVSYFPMLVVLDKPDAFSFPTWFHVVSPLAGFIFLGMCLLVWKVGVRHYRSTGS